MRAADDPLDPAKAPAKSTAPSSAPATAPAEIQDLVNRDQRYLNARQRVDDMDIMISQLIIKLGPNHDMVVANQKLLAAYQQKLDDIRKELIAEKQLARTRAAEKGPTGQADDLVAAATPPLPADLVAEHKDYVITRNDLLTVTIHDLNGPGVETVKTSRVSEAGAIRLPLLDAVKAAGFTEAELEKEIAKAYVTANLLRNAQVSVTVAEARGRTFSVLGGVAQPGQYAIVDPDTRVLDALVLSKGDYRDRSGVHRSKAAAPGH